MPERLPAAIHEKLRQRLTYYDDLGIQLFYRTGNTATPACPEERTVCANLNMPSIPLETPNATNSPRGEAISGGPDVNVPRTAGEAQFSNAKIPTEEPLPKTSPKPVISTAPRVLSSPSAARIEILPKAPEVSLFDAVNKVPNDTLLKVREDLGDCRRCKLHSTRKTIVFADGNPKAELVFVGEGPGHDEDVQGLPFVGRAGKLLNQMIEAMGLQRKDVYICNVVKCRPPENRLPERDEIECCSPFLLRQLDVISPKVIVCLGACSAQTLLQTNRGISHFRGQWLDFRGHKLMATYHPAYLLRNPAAKSEVWKDLQKVMAVLGLEVKRKSAEASRSS
jgi:uracil-DNA glycosylase family 4